MIEIIGNLHIAPAILILAVRKFLVNAFLKYQDFSIRRVVLEYAAAWRVQKYTGITI